MKSYLTKRNLLTPKVWLVTCLLCALIAPQAVLGQNSTEPSSESFSLFVPFVSNVGNNTFQPNNQQQFVWRLNYNQEVGAASLGALSSFGREWIQRQLDICEQILLDQNATLEKKHGCEMLSYTLAGQFTEAEIALIMVNDGILMAVAESKTDLPHGNNSVSAAAIDAVHPDTNDVLYVTTTKGWWTPNVTHSAYAGAPNSGATYNRIKMHIASAKDGGQNRYDTWVQNSNKDIKSDSRYHGWCCFGGGSAYTEAWFKSHQGNEVYGGYAILHF